MIAIHISRERRPSSNRSAGARYCSNCFQYLLRTFDTRVKNYQEFQAILLFSRCVIYMAVIPQVFCYSDGNVYFMILDVLRMEVLFCECQ